MHQLVLTNGHKPLWSVVEKGRRLSHMGPRFTREKKRVIQVKPEREKMNLLITIAPQICCSSQGQTWNKTYTTQRSGSIQISDRYWQIPFQVCWWGF